MIFKQKRKSDVFINIKVLTFYYVFLLYTKIILKCTHTCTRVLCKVFILEYIAEKCIRTCTRTFWMYLYISCVLVLKYIDLCSAPFCIK